jgi:predicted membrane protein
MVPPLLEIEIDAEEEFPLAKVKVPPEITGLALLPKLLRDTVEPEVTVMAVTEILTMAVAAA